MSPRHEAAFSWFEVIVLIAVLAVLATLAMPRITCRPVKGTMTQTLSNMKQLHLATHSMELDGIAERNTNRAWPGDTGGTFTNWTRQLVPAYLETKDFCKLLSAPGVRVPTSVLPTKMTEGALCIYAVRGESSGDVVFLTTANFTNTPQGGAALLKSAKPYGDTGFVVFRKGGDGATLQKGQAGHTNLIGTYAPLLE